MYNMTGIAKFYNEFLSFIELDPTRPTHICKFSDPARPAGRPDPRATVHYMSQLHFRKTRLDSSLSLMCDLCGRMMIYRHG